ncbi:hypothetical protein [Mycoplasma sp. E35C]|uniref:hypothetical protein n=1 Tax=Mycoplasma sp. E35C TaxID=2801918 RepID=UPI001CA393A8|nr:hypothetical protein [Mycoplasma sp. E35C]QZX49468.1 hypothetical protein JJE79_01845 [Mycoplasma sp. E35C]
MIIKKQGLITKKDQKEEIKKLLEKTSIRQLLSAKTISELSALSIVDIYKQLKQTPENIGIFLIKPLSYYANNLKCPGVFNNQKLIQAYKNATMQKAKSCKGIVVADFKFSLINKFDANVLMTEIKTKKAVKEFYEYVLFSFYEEYIKTQNAFLEDIFGDKSLNELKSDLSDFNDRLDNKTVSLQAQMNKIFAKKVLSNQITLKANINKFSEFKKTINNFVDVLSKNKTHKFNIGYLDRSKWINDLVLNSKPIQKKDLVMIIPDKLALKLAKKNLIDYLDLTSTKLDGITLMKLDYKSDHIWLFDKNALKFCPTVVSVDHNNLFTYTNFNFELGIDINKLGIKINFDSNQGWTKQDVLKYIVD